MRVSYNEPIWFGTLIEFPYFVAAFKYGIDISLEYNFSAMVTARYCQSSARELSAPLWGIDYL